MEHHVAFLASAASHKTASSWISTTRQEPSMTTAAIHHDSVPSSSRALRVGLWVVQSLLAAAFLMAGGMPWISGAMGTFVRWIGAAEVAGALGLILPSATRIQPRLTVLAAGGLVLLMLGAAATHVARGEFGALAAPLVLAALSALVTWGRSGRASIAPR
jgi:putative oxidoreductase